MLFLVPFTSVRLIEINPEYFRKVKIKKLSFMFRGIGGKTSLYGDVRKYGVILPLFVIQIIGIILTLINIVLACILYFVVKIDYFTITIISLIVLTYILILVAVIVICMIKSKSNK